MDSFPARQVFPEYKMNEQFVTDVVHDAMAFDGLRNSRPMNIKVTTPSEIKELFDAIAYQKGRFQFISTENIQLNFNDVF